MQPTVADYRDLIRAEGDSLLAQLERLTDDEWALPSPCDGWDLLDVIVHLQIGLIVHTRMVESGLAGGMEPAWNLPEDVDAREHFRQVHRESHDAGAAPNVALLRERLAGYDAALAQVTDADLAKPAWFYGLPDSNLRRPIAALTNDLIVHASDIRRPLGLEPTFSPAGARFAGAATLAYLPMFTSPERLQGASGVVRQTIDGVISRVTLGASGIQVTPDATASSPTSAAPTTTTSGAPSASTSGAPSVAGSTDPGDSANDPSAPRTAELATDGGTWALIVWRSFPAAAAEQQGRLQITGDRALVEAYLGAIKTP